MQPLSGLCLPIMYAKLTPWTLYYFSWISQPIQAFKHPLFQNMIHVASHATNGVKIPDCCQTQQAIIDTFKEQLGALHDRLNVWDTLQHSLHFFFNILLQSDWVKGKVSLTCDACQASNSDGYLAVTGSWIEEVNGKWQIQSALLGFTQLNNAHNGICLGQALFKIVSCLHIGHKVSVGG